MKSITVLIFAILFSTIGFAQPEISITGGVQEVEIPNGSSTPNTGDGTDFGEKIVGESRTNIFTIDNSGGAELNLLSDPRVVIGGANAADFVVTTQPASPIGPSTDSEFEITFTPSGIGERTAMVSISNDDPDENPYTFTIKGTGLDISPPQIVCPDEQLQILDPSCNLTLADYRDSVIVSDNLDPNPVITQNPLQGSILNGAGTIDIVMTATDASGNSASCTFSLAKEDVMSPMIDQFPDQTMVGGGGCAAILPDYTAMVTVSDNCDQSPDIIQDPPPTDLVTDGTQVVITVIDASNNSSEMTFTINILDEEAPNISPIADMEIGVNENCIGVIPDFSLQVVVSDNCDNDPNIEQSPTAGTIITEATQVMITATDSSGNSSSTMFTATPKDLTGPVMTCPENIGVESSEPIVVNYTIPTGMDNCDASVTPHLSAGLNSGSTFPLGTTTVTWEAIDSSGNIGDCSFTVFVGMDSEAPTITCPGVQSQQLDENCNTTLFDYRSLAQVEDDMDPNPSVTQSPNVGALLIGTSNTEITLTATDASGNSSSCTFMLLVVDTLGPVVTCPANLTIESSSAPATVVYTTPTANDNCSPNVLPTLTSGPASGELFQEGETIVTWTATDDNGNTGTCSFSVNVEVISAITEINEKALAPIPNPTTGIVRFDTDLANENIQVFNLQGQRIYSSSIPSNGRIDFSPFAEGLYIVRFENSKYGYTRLIIQR